MHSIFSQVMIGRQLMEGGEWFLPILEGFDSKDIDKCKQRVGYVFCHYLNAWLKEWWNELNSVIIRKNVDEHCNIPLIDKECTFYSYRHSFAQVYLQNGGNILSLATLLGRSVNSISTYVQQLSRNEDLVEAISVMD